MYKFTSTKIIELGSCAFRQPKADSHCKYLHGYRLTAKFWFEANNLDENNWVVDFGSLKGLKKVLESQFDHTTCISRTDPKLDMFKKLRDAGVCDLRIMDGVGIEKFAEFCHDVAQHFVDELTDGRCRCVADEVFEHKKNSAIYKGVDKQTQTAEEEAESIATAVDNKQAIVNVEKPVSKVKAPRSKTVTDDTTRPPFGHKTTSQSKTKLWPKKEKNKWMSGESTWGF